MEGQEFLDFQREMQIYLKVMSQAGEIIRDQEVSKYPIFVVHAHEVSIGLPIVEKEKFGGKWNIHASTLEEFVSKNLVFEEKMEDFIKNYKDPDDYLCIFLLSELGANFVYLPKKKQIWEFNDN
jgi:hypothetical protein